VQVNLPSLLIAAMGTLVAVSCATKQAPPAAPTSVATLRSASTTPTNTGDCPADAAWLQQPTLPGTVPGTGTDCNFDQLMWQSLIALVQPTAGNPEILEYETWMPSYGIFVKEGEPAAWGTEPPVPCSEAADDPDASGQPRRLYTDIIKQAGSDQPLMDLQGEYVYYDMSVNKSAYDMIVGCGLFQENCAGPLKPHNKGIDLNHRYPNLAFPNAAVELKSSWMVLSESAAASGLFHTVPGWIQYKGGACRAVTLGMTGLHIVSKVPGFPAMIWGTFEHRNNAPDCDSTSASPPLGGTWNFYNPGCTDCATNTYKPDTPGQICRMHPFGDSRVGTFPDGNDCSANPNQFACQPSTAKILDESTQALRSLNGNVWTLLQANPDLIDPVWANYELVGNVWTIGEAIPPYLQAQRGALSASNTSMESFVQNGVAGVTNPYSCLSCHNMTDVASGGTLPPVGLSHLFHNVQKPGGCSDGALPATCAAYIGQ
jgi:hypothetical protein